MNRHKVVQMTAPVFATFLALGAASCNYNELSVEETDTVLTIEDKGRDYTESRSYALTDKVIDLCELAGEDGYISGNGGEGGSVSLGECFEVSHALDDDILNAIERNMKERGFKRVDSMSDNPDLAIVVGIVARDNWYYAPGYYWCDPYYYYSCWYPPVNYVYNLPTSSILINMIDAQNSHESSPKSAWFVALSGLYATSSDLSGASRVERAVNKAFKQSPYLEAGK